MARSIANTFGGNNSQRRWDLADEAESYLGLLVCRLSNSSFDSQKAALSTWLFTAVGWHLLTQLTKATIEAKAVARYFDQAVVEAKQEARTHCLLTEAECVGRRLKPSQA